MPVKSASANPVLFIVNVVGLKVEALFTCAPLAAAVGFTKRKLVLFVVTSEKEGLPAVLNCIPAVVAPRARPSPEVNVQEALVLLSTWKAPSVKFTSAKPVASA